MVEATNVSKSFGKVNVLNSVSFKLGSEKVTGLIGANGAGKSTLIRMIATLIKPDSGNIHVAGFDTQKNPFEVRKRIGVLLGGEIYLYNRLTARENILYYAQMQGIPKGLAQTRINEYAEKLDICEYIDRKTFGFSVGMRQKVAFIRSIIHDPDILLLDEPSTGLDLISANVVHKMIQQYKDCGKSILISTHNPYEMESLCDDFLFVKHRTIHAFGEKNQLLATSEQTNVFDAAISFLGEGTK